MQQKSALTAALTNAKSDGPSSIAQQAPLDSNADVFSFPCLTDRPREMSEHFETALSFKGSLPGSAPIATLLFDGSLAADYTLNPHRLRGGEEVVPMAVVGSLKAASASLQSNYVGEALINSLPRGMTTGEREKVLQSMPLSPTMNLLSSMPTDRIVQRSLEGRKLRRHLLRGAVIVFVTAGYSGKRFIFEKAKELGVRAVVLDGPDSWSQMMEKEGLIDAFVPIDFTDADTVFQRCLAAIERVKQELGEVDGVCTFCEMAVPLVARLAEKLGLPSNTPAAVDAARDKHATRTIMGQAGLPTPKNYLIERTEDVELAAKHVGFPAVIKPIFGAASLGVVKVTGPKELQATYVRVQKEMASARIVAGALQAGSEDGSLDPNHQQEKDRKASSWIKTTLMLEEYLDGPEVDVDVIFSNGVAVYGAITDNWPTVEPYFNETGSNCPSILPLTQQKELLELGVASVRALGLTEGVFHVELKYTSRGPRLIEVNCRMGGGPVRNINLLVWGVDLVEEHLLVSAGIPSRPPLPPSPLTYIAEYSLNAPCSGTIEHIDFCKDWEKSPNVLYARPLVETGQKVTGPEHGMPTWVAELMVEKEDIHAAIRLVTHIEKSIKVPISHSG